MPPIFISVVGFLTTNCDPVLGTPSVRFKVPPLLPDKVAGGVNIVIKVPVKAVNSKRAGLQYVPIGGRMISPEEERIPLDRTVTSPPRVPVGIMVPKLRCCNVLTVTAIGFGGFS